MDSGNIFGRGIAFPPRVNEAGALAWSEGPDNVRDSIQIILLTETRERLFLPDFGGGLRSFLFALNTASTRRMIEERILRALGRWEPRIKVKSVQVEPSATDSQAAEVTIRYELIASRVQDRMNLTLKLSQ
jgi:uncharacterized protein